MARSKGKQAKENALADRRAERPFLESTLDAFRDNGFTASDTFEIISYVQDNAHPIPEPLKARYEGLADDEYDRVMLASKDLAAGYKKYEAQASGKASLKDDIGKIFNDKHFRGGNVINEHLRSTQSISSPNPQTEAESAAEENATKDNSAAKFSNTQIAAVSTAAATAALAGHTAIKKWSEKRSPAQAGAPDKEKKESASSKKAVAFAVVGAVLLGGVGLMANHALAAKLPQAGNSQSR